MFGKILDFLFSLNRVHIGAGTRFAFVFDHVGLILFLALVLAVLGYLSYMPQSASPNKKRVMGILRALLDDPTVRRKVRLVYIDPPFATGGVFESRNGEHAYEDLAQGAHYLEFLRQRLIVLGELNRTSRPTVNSLQPTTLGSATLFKMEMVH